MRRPEGSNGANGEFLFVGSPERMMSDLGARTLQPLTRFTF